MTSRPAPRLAGGLLAVLAAACGGAEQPAPVPERPHLVLIVVDTLRADAVAPDTSAGIAPLVEDGCVFTNAFAHAPITLPSHTTMFTSRLPLETGVVVNVTQYRGEQGHLAEHLRERGYQTAGVLSTHMIGGSKVNAHQAAFDVWERDFFFMRQAPEVLDATVAALDALDPDEPFFLFVHFSDPHVPYNAHGSDDVTVEVSRDGAPFRELSASDMSKERLTLELRPGRNELAFRSDRPFRVMRLKCAGAEVVWELGAARDRLREARVAIVHEGERPARREIDLVVVDVPTASEHLDRYRREVRFVMDRVGALLEELERRGVFDDSVVVFTSDHGESLGQHGLQGHVHGLWDELLRVPLVIKPPAGDPRLADLRARRHGLFPLIDLAPTLLHLLDQPALPDQAGASILAGPDAGGRVLIAETHRPEADRDLICLRDERYKLIHFIEEDRFEMYDVVSDPGEKVDRFDELRHERPEWVERARRLGQLSLQADAENATVPQELAEDLDALGY